VWRVLLLAVATLAIGGISCAPTVDTVADRQRAVDRDDGAQLAAQLTALPGAVSAQVTLRRPVAEPLAPSPPVSPSASAAILIIVDDRADRAAIAAAARQLARGAAPELADPQIVVEVGAHRAELARVGPFSVEDSSRRALIATLAAALALIAGLALAVAAYARRGSKAQ